MDKSKIWWEFLFKNRIFPKISNKLRYNISSYDCPNMETTSFPNMETRRTKRRNCTGHKRIKTTLFFDIKKFQDLDFRSKSLNLIFFTRYTYFTSTIPSSKRLKIELHYMEPFLKTLWGQVTQSTRRGFNFRKSNRILRNIPYIGKIFQRFSIDSKRFPDSNHILRKIFPKIFNKIRRQWYLLVRLSGVQVSSRCT